MASTFLKTDSLHEWLQTPPGQYMLAWEQKHFDLAVSDAFGFHALQLGLPQCDALEANRMPHKFMACDGLPSDYVLERPLFLTNYEALPFKDVSLDLVVLPHTLELSFDPHATLREVERVLVPEGRVVICGMEPLSLWGASKTLGRGVPEFGDLISQRRIRDWLKLLSFEVDQQTSGCFRPMLRTDRWLQRMRWMDTVGSRWWPLSGAVYFVQAVKRVRGMRLISPVWKKSKQRAAAAVTTASKGME
ncbi:MAG: methyltransferase domain-containing protein [Betaproteobacteria bacterium]